MSDQAEYAIRLTLVVEKTNSLGHERTLELSEAWFGFGTSPADAVMVASMTAPDKIRSNLGRSS